MKYTPTPGGPLPRRAHPASPSAIAFKLHHTWHGRRYGFKPCLYPAILLPHTCRVYRTPHTDEVACDKQWYSHRYWERDSARITRDSSQSQYAFWRSNVISFLWREQFLARIARRRWARANIRDNGFGGGDGR